MWASHGLGRLIFLQIEADLKWILIIKTLYRSLPTWHLILKRSFIIISKSNLVSTTKIIIIKCMKDIFSLCFLNLILVIVWRSWKLPLSFFQKNCHIFQKNCHWRLFLKKWQFLAIKKKSNVWHFSDIQMTIFRRVRSIGLKAWR